MTKVPHLKPEQFCHGPRIDEKCCLVIWTENILGVIDVGEGRDFYDLLVTETSNRGGLGSVGTWNDSHELFEIAEVWNTCADRYNGVKCES